MTTGRFNVDITTIDHSLAAFCKTQGGASNTEGKQSGESIPTKQRPVPLMKIDVEGFEANALHGTMTSTLSFAQFLPARSRQRRHRCATTCDLHILFYFFIALLDTVR